MVLNLRLQPMFVHILIVVEKKPLLLFEVELLRHVQQQCSLHYGSFIKCVKFFSKGKFLKKIILVFFFNAHKVTWVSKNKTFHCLFTKISTDGVMALFYNFWSIFNKKISQNNKFNKNSDIFRYFKAVSCLKFINQGPKESQVCTMYPGLNQFISTTIEDLWIAP